MAGSLGSHPANRQAVLREDASSRLRIASLFFELKSMLRRNGGTVAMLADLVASVKQANGEVWMWIVHCISFSSVSFL